MLLLMIFLALYGCRIKECTQNFSFEFPLSVTLKDTFNIGDTIWFEMQSNKEVLDVYSGEYYNLEHIIEYFEFIIEKIDTNHVNSVGNQFSFITSKGEITSLGGHFNDYHISLESRMERVFKFGIIPSEKGKYQSAMSLPIEIYYLENGEYKGQNLIIHSTNCRQVMYPYSSVVTNNGSTNRHLLDSTCYQVSPTDPSLICYDPNDEIPLSGRGTFAFVVK